MGRTAWADVVRNARTMGRLIWYHVPLRLTPGANANRNPQELAKVMAEKRMALDLVEACVPSSFVSFHFIGMLIIMRHQIRCSAEASPARRTGDLLRGPV
jgi:hypothetical protein